MQEPMTPYGYEKITRELNELRSERPVVANEIQKAAELGDLKENAEYHAAKERMNLLESRVAQLESLVGKANIIDPSKLAHTRVSFGSTVKLCDIDTEEEFAYTIVGTIESDVSRGLISFGSLLAKSILGKEEGEEVTVNLPAGEKTYEIVEIFYMEIQFD